MKEAEVPEDRTRLVQECRGIRELITLPVSTTEHTWPEMGCCLLWRERTGQQPWHARAVGVLIRGAHSRARHLLAICVKILYTIFNHFPLIWLLAVVCRYILQMQYIWSASLVLLPYLKNRIKHSFGRVIFANMSKWHAWTYGQHVGCRASKTCSRVSWGVRAWVTSTKAAQD